MENLEKTLASGAVLTLNPAPWPVAKELHLAVIRELEAVRIEFGATKLDMQEVFKSQIDDKAINTFKNLICRLIASETVQVSLWKCVERCLYNGQKISDKLFEPVEARGDYLLIEKEVLWFNLLPFLKDLLSLFPPLQALRNISDQK